MTLKKLAGILFGLSFLISAAACADETLQEKYEGEMKDDKMDGFQIIQIEENERYGLIVHTAWTKQYPDNKNRPGIRVYYKDGGKWTMRPGTACGMGISRLSIPDKNTLYCGALTKKRPFKKIMVGDQEAKIFPVIDDIRVWYAVGQGRKLKVKGITENGNEHKF